MLKKLSKANLFLCVLWLIIIFVVGSGWALADAPMVYVDDSAAEGGDGSIGYPVRTIQEGIELLPEGGGTVVVYPGIYIGPILIEKSGTVIQGIARPVFVDGYVSSFTNDGDPDDEVVITIDRMLTGVNFNDRSQQPEAEDVIEVRGSNIEVRDLVVDLGDFELLAEHSVLSAKAEDDDFYDNIVFSEIVVHGIVDTVGWSRNANVTFHQIVSTEPGYLGLNPMGNGEVVVSEVFFANKEGGVEFLSRWEYPKGENPPSKLKGVIRDSRFEDGQEMFGIFDPPGYGLLLLGRGGLTNPDARIVIAIEAYNNVFKGNLAGVGVVAWGRAQEDVEKSKIELRAYNNVYQDNDQDTVISFQSFLSQGAPVFIEDATIKIHDRDGVFSQVDTGPKENKNKLIINSNDD